ncbi:hypothetical protein B0H16DRAFT_1886837 [Mycena metata]|uniref:Uncharacterized protein n=1 Tax=Mycena metata TaxID=1033252 RepID=A0AAD7NCB6_9AGAR|nr:hypothetical protein B0H16DRAFT_1886837 [Mycena metata]
MSTAGQHKLFRSRARAPPSQRLGYFYIYPYLFAAAGADLLAIGNSAAGPFTGELHAYQSAVRQSLFTPPARPQLEVPEIASVTQVSESNIGKKTSVTGSLRRASSFIRRSASSSRTPSLRGVPPAEVTIARN